MKAKFEHIWVKENLGNIIFLMKRDQEGVLVDFYLQQEVQKFKKKKEIHNDKP